MAKNLSPPDRGKEKIVFLGLNNSMQFLWFACCNTHPLFTPIQNLTNTHPNSATNDNDSLHTTTHIECWILCCRAPHVCYFFGITHNNNCLFACRFKYFKLEITRCRLCCLPVTAFTTSIYCWIARLITMKVNSHANMNPLGLILDQFRSLLNSFKLNLNIVGLTWNRPVHIWDQAGHTVGPLP